MKKIVITSILLFTIAQLSFAFSSVDSNEDNSLYQWHNGEMHFDDQHAFIWESESTPGESEIVLRSSDDDWLFGDGDDQKTGAPISDGLYLLLLFSFLYMIRHFYLKPSLKR